MCELLKQCITLHAGWTYDAQGKLVKAPRITGIQDFAVADFGLKALPVAEWGPFVFLCLDDIPPDDAVAHLHDWIGAQAPFTTMHGSVLQHGREIARLSSTASVSLWPRFCSSPGSSRACCSPGSSRACFLLEATGHAFIVDAVWGWHACRAARCWLDTPVSCAGAEPIQLLKEAGVLDDDMVHVRKQSFALRCNWKVRPTPTLTWQAWRRQQVAWLARPLAVHTCTVPPPTSSHDDASLCSSLWS